MKCFCAWLVTALLEMERGRGAAIPTSEVCSPSVKCRGYRERVAHFQTRPLLHGALPAPRQTLAISPL